MSQHVSYFALSKLTLEAVTETVLVCLVGYIAARVGLVDKSIQKNLANLNVQIFTPALVFSKLGRSLSLSTLVDVIAIPVFFVVATGVSAASGRLMARIFKLNKDESNFVTAMSVFGNSNSLPVSLTVNLAYTLPGLEWKDVQNDTRDKIVSRGILYLLIFQQLGQIVRWSWGYNTLLARSQPASSETLLPVDTAPRENTWLSCIRKVPQRILEFMNPPLWAMLGAIFIASVPALKQLFFDSDTAVRNTVSEAIQQLGSIAIPFILFILGANLAPTGLAVQKDKNYNRIVLASLVGRMILPCVVLLPLIAMAVRYIHLSILDDPIFLLVAFILTVAPPAIQLSQICQIKEVFETEMAGVMFWGYVILTLPTTIFIVVASIEVLEWALRNR